MRVITENFRKIWWTDFLKSLNFYIFGTQKYSFYPNLSKLWNFLKNTVTFTHYLVPTFKYNLDKLMNRFRESFDSVPKKDPFFQF